MKRLIWLAASGSIFSFLCCVHIPLDAAKVVSTPKAKKYLDPQPVLSAQELYARGSDLYNVGKWDKAAKEFRTLTLYFPDSTYAQDAYYYLGVCYFNIDELDLANEAFDRYLNAQSNPQYFKDCVAYKFHIAERLRMGDRCRYFGIRHMPKWSQGDHIAVQAYDQVIAALPNDEMTAYALYGKGLILKKQKEYRESVEAFQTLIHRFPKHELAPESFLEINRVYLTQSQSEYQNPDLLSFAEINLKRFEQQFPSEERLESAKEELLRLKEVYAQGMYETAYFYERINQPAAAVMYYQKAIVEFPETHVAFKCRDRLREFCPRALEDLNRGLKEFEPSSEMHEDIDFS